MLLSSTKPTDEAQKEYKSFLEIRPIIHDRTKTVKKMYNRFMSNPLSPTERNEYISQCKSFPPNGTSEKLYQELLDFMAKSKIHRMTVEDDAETYKWFIANYYNAKLHLFQKALENILHGFACHLMTNVFSRPKFVNLLQHHISDNCAIYCYDEGLQNVISWANYFYHETIAMSEGSAVEQMKLAPIMMTE